MSEVTNIPQLRFPEFSDEWEEKKLGDVTSWSSGGTPSKAVPHYWNGKIPWISASSMKGKYFIDSKLKITLEGLKAGSKLAPKNSILLLVRGSMLFKKIPFGLAETDVAFNQDVKCLKVLGESTFDFIYYWFCHSENHLLNMVTGTGIGAGKLETSYVQLMNVNIPEFLEQEKIAAFLTTVDNKIEQLSKKQELLKEYKKGLMQQIFSQAIRFKSDDGGTFPDWEEKNGNEIFDNISNKNHDSDLPILAITQEHGAIPRDLINYKMIVSDKSVSSYKVVETGDFIISLRSFQGGIEYSNYKGICSPAYIILRPAIEIEKKFYKYYLKTYRYIQDLNRKLEGIRDGKMVSYKYFSEIKLPYPSISEQAKIANFLSSIDNKIEQVGKQLDESKQFKKALLQQMFV